VNGVYQHDHFFLALPSQSQTQSLLLGRTRRAFVAATLGVTGCSRLDYAPGVFSVAEPTVDVPAAPSFRNYTRCGAVFSSEHRIELKRRLRAGYLLPLEALVILIALTAGNFARGPQPGDFARLD